MTGDGDDDDSVLENYNDYLIKRNSIVFVYMIIAILLGVCGNAVSFMFYRSKQETVTHFLIAALALNDLVSSVTSINIVILYCYYVTNRNETFCHISFFFGHTFVLISVFMLVLIGLQRYIRICSMNERYQLTNSRVKVITIIVVIVSIAISARSFVLAGVQEIPHTVNTNRTITVYTCTYSRAQGYAQALLTFRIIDCVVFIFGNVSLIILYTLIIRKIRRVGNSRVLSQTNITPVGLADVSNAAVENGSNVNDDADVNRLTYNNKGQKITDRKFFSFRKPGRNTSNITKANTFRITSNIIKSNSDVNINMMMLVTTVASIVSFLPYFCLELFDGASYSFAYTPLEHVAHRSWMLNSSINPYVMAIFNADLRRFVKSQIWSLRCLKH